MRPAALADGGSRLTAEDLPLVLRFADGDDVKMQLAALTALRHFGEPAAIDKLLFYARKNVEPTVSAAIESLAASRYAVAHQALLDVLKKEHPASRRLIVRVLAKYPRPLWSDTIYSFIGDPEPEVAVEALRALVETGHPRLLDLLQGCAGSRHGRRSRRGVSTAVEAERSAERGIGARVCAAIDEDGTRPARACTSCSTAPRIRGPFPLLLAALDRSSGSRTQIINTLAQIGDQSVGDALAAKYPTFSDRDKGTTLNALQLLKSPQFRRFAGEALTRGDSALVSTAINGFAERRQSASGAIAGQCARVAPRIRPSGPTSRGPWRISARRRRSWPSTGAGLRESSQAQAGARCAEDSEPTFARISGISHRASVCAKRTLGRGHFPVQRGHRARSRAFGRLFRPRPRRAADQETGRGAQRFRESDQARSLQCRGGQRLGDLPGHGGQHPDRDEDHRRFAIEAQRRFCLHLQRGLRVRPGAWSKRSSCPPSPERDKKADEFRKKAIADLQLSVKLGFPDLDWMKKDSDLDSLHGLPEFKRIVSPDDKHSPDENSGDDPNGDSKTTRLTSCPPIRGRPPTPPEKARSAKAPVRKKNPTQGDSAQDGVPSRERRRPFDDR